MLFEHVCGAQALVRGQEDTRVGRGTRMPRPTPSPCPTDPARRGGQAWGKEEGNRDATEGGGNSNDPCIGWYGVLSGATFGYSPVAFPHKFWISSDQRIWQESCPTWTGRWLSVLLHTPGNQGSPRRHVVPGWSLPPRFHGQVAGDGLSRVEGTRGRVGVEHGCVQCLLEIFHPVKDPQQRGEGPPWPGEMLPDQDISYRCPRRSARPCRWWPGRWRGRVRPTSSGASTRRVRPVNA